MTRGQAMKNIFIGMMFAFVATAACSKKEGTAEDKAKAAAEEAVKAGGEAVKAGGEATMEGKAAVKAGAETEAREQ